MTIDPVLAWSLRIAGALLFSSAAVHKLHGPEGFRAALSAYRLLPKRAIGPLGFGIPCLEALVAAASLSPLYPWACGLGALLLLVYGAAIAVNLSRGRRELDCGCGGAAPRQPISGALVIRNLLLAAAFVLVALSTADRTLVWLDYLTIAGLVGFAGFAYVSADLVMAAPETRRAGVEA